MLKRLRREGELGCAGKVEFQAGRPGLNNGDTLSRGETIKKETSITRKIGELIGLFTLGPSHP